MRSIISVTPAHPVLKQALRSASQRALPVAGRARCFNSTRPMRSDTDDKEDSWKFPASDASQTADSSSTVSSSSDAASSSTTSSDSIASNKSPFDDLFSGDDPFPTTSSPNRWLPDHPSRSRNRDRAPESVPRSVLFTKDSAPPMRERKKFDRSPLSRQEANAFVSLLNSAIDPDAPPPRSDIPTDDNLFGGRGPSSKSQPFGAFTDLISHSSPQQKSRYQLEAYLSRNRLKPRFEESRMARARRSAREGLAAQFSQAQLDAGIDEAREELSMCESEFEVWAWAKKEVWGLGGSVDALLPISLEQTEVLGKKAADANREDSPEATEAAPTQSDSESSADPASTSPSEEQGADGKTIADAPSEAQTATEGAAPAEAETTTSSSSSSEAAQHKSRFGKETPFFAPVLHLIFMTLRDRYRSPHSALAVYDFTRSLGLESYVLGCTAALFTDLLRTRWDQLSDLESCRTLLRHARETGVLSDPASRRRELMRIKGQSHRRAGMPVVPPAEDERIREVVDRIRSEARKAVLHQVQTRKVDALVGLFGKDDVGEDDGREEAEARLDKPNWAQQKTLDLADELGRLAGPPSRLVLGMS